MWTGQGGDIFSEQRFRRRVQMTSVLFAAGYAFIIFRLFFLQVVKGSDLAKLSESNRTQLMALRAPRGDFYDRKGRLLVENRPSWSLVYSVPEKTHPDPNELRNVLKPYLDSLFYLWERRLERALQTGQIVRLADDVPDSVAFALKEIEQVLPGLRVVMEFRRGYPMGVFANHLIGYLGEINDRELKTPMGENRKPGDLVGKMGLEKIYDSYLRGQDGGMLTEIDSVGRLKRIIRELPYVRGGSVHLTLDMDAQRIAEEELRKTESRRGAVVAMDVITGAVYVWASAPSFDPMTSFADDLKDANAPFLDRVYKAAYPPGSTFKAMTAIAGLERGWIQTAETVNCIGYVMLKERSGKERRYRCWTRHGVVDFWGAMAGSCDTYFYQLGKKVGPQAIADTALQFGFGHNVQTILPHEVKGTIPTPAWKRKMGWGGWSTGDTYNMSIGQGFVTSTPLQVATMMAAIATRGPLHHPYVVDRIVDAKQQVVYKALPEVERNIALKETTWSVIDRSLGHVVTGGTGAATFVSYLDVRGKTGTAQNPHGEDHAWFAGYAGPQGQPPSVALCVFVENGGHGGAVAAPIVRRVLESLFAGSTK